MAAWKKVALVALGGLVGLVPAFTQLSYAQALSESVSVLPLGEELPDEELLEVKGEWFWFWVILWELVVGALTGWLVYRPTGDVMEAAIWGLYAMTVTTIGWAVPIPR